ncbi:hypothetical protein GCL00_25890 [Klebsiella pneumoniae]|uniref:hypothetical protein n=1 Tax=Klebsiella pneumoniae TaxID=573 RepID=UPI00126516AD|nr:hypothetical protein [Klebsiella pneumoniae]KAB8022112.1 hypothetical protein GCL00_25890 [Klebsiella pneumoniae]
MKTVSVLSAAILLSGCAAMDNSKDTRLNSFSGITYENNGTYEIIKNMLRKVQERLIRSGLNYVLQGMLLIMAFS